MSVSTPALKTTDLTKAFRVYRRPLDRIKQAVSLGRRRYFSEFCALKDVDLEVAQGETVGLIGQNGSGKSTLLKILALLMRPTSGEVRVNGRVASIIELGTGFHPEFTGRANVFMTGSLMGFTRAEIEEIFPEILEFSELGQFIERPVKTYSSGMWVRLAFSTAISVRPEVLLIDEALAVGDLLFQKKCISRLKEYQSSGVSMVFVSHDLEAIKSLCHRVLLMDKGEVLSQGPPSAVTSEYVSLIAERANQVKLSDRSTEEKRRYGSYDGEISSVEMLSASGEPTRAVACGESVWIDIEVEIHRSVEHPAVGFLIRDRLGNDVFGTNTALAGMKLSNRPGRWKMRIGLDLELGPRHYFLSVALHSGTDHLGVCYDWVENAVDFEVLPCGHAFSGYARLKPTFEVLERDRAGSKRMAEAGG